MNTQIKQMDFLATQVLNALKKTDMDSSWIAGKEFEYRDKSRLEILRSLSNFDSENLAAICKELSVTVEDIRATLRVLQKI